MIPYDKSGTLHTVCELDIGADTYSIDVFHDQPPSAGAEMDAYLTVLIVKNGDSANPLAKESIAVNNLNNFPYPLEERWSTFMNRLRNKVSVLVIDGVVPKMEAQIIWERIQGLALTFDGANLDVIEHGQ